MKNNSLLSLFLLLSSFTFINQTSAQDCEQATAQIDIDVNNVRARLLIGGDLWWDGDDGRYIVPKSEPGNPEVSAFFAGGLWIGGFDYAESSLKLAAQTYGAANGKTDYWPGPLSENGTTTEDDCSNFDRFWSTNSTDINTHVADWSDNGVIDGPIPESLLAWPGQGNPNFQSIHGFDLPNTIQGFAPFFDIGDDGIYNPQDGDFPNVNGADQAHWWVFNDAGGIHTESNSNPLQFEIQVLAYAFSSTNDNINNATFYDYKFVNRASNPIDSTFVGIWSDPDLGCGLDDQVGCNIAHDLGFVYNSDALDGGISCNDCNGVNTYCEEIPVAGIKILKGVTAIENGNVVDRGMSVFTYYNNASSQPAPLPGTEDPNSAPEHYNYLSGSWRDGLRFTYGGDGHNPTSTEFTNYAFPGAPNDQEGWSMCSEGFEGSDRRMIVGSGPFHLDPGGVNTLSFAVIFAEDVPHPCPDISPLLEVADDVQNHFDNIVTSTEQFAITPANIQFQPNPMTNQAELIFNELENTIQQVSIYSIDGKLMRVYDSVYGNSLTIERNELGQGMYFYKILTDDFQVYSGKFIVQ